MLGKEIIEIIKTLEFGAYTFGGLFFLNETPTVWTKNTFRIFNLSLRQASSTQYFTFAPHFCTSLLHHTFAQHFCTILLQIVYIQCYSVDDASAKEPTRGAIGLFSYAHPSVTSEYKFQFPMRVQMNNHATYIFRYFCFDSLGTSQSFVDAHFPVTGKVYYNLTPVQSRGSHQCAW